MRRSVLVLADRRDVAGQLLGDRAAARVGSRLERLDVVAGWPARPAVTLRTKSWNCSFLATKSVSELTSTATPVVPSTATPTRPSAAVRLGLLGGGGEALGAQPVDRGFQVAAGLVERLLAIHHAGAGALAQVLHRRRL